MRARKMFCLLSSALVAFLCAFSITEQSTAMAFFSYTHPFSFQVRREVKRAGKMFCLLLSALVASMRAFNITEQRTAIYGFFELHSSILFSTLLREVKFLFAGRPRKRFKAGSLALQVTCGVMASFFGRSCHLRTGLTGNGTTMT